MVEDISGEGIHGKINIRFPEHFLVNFAMLPTQTDYMVQG